jgi:hypothetical protein
MVLSPSPMSLVTYAYFSKTTVHVARQAVKHSKASAHPCLYSKHNASRTVLN